MTALHRRRKWYTNFIVNEDPSGGTIITDPILSDASAAEHLIGRDKHTPNIALLGNYIASFANGLDFVGSTPVIAQILSPDAVARSGAHRVTAGPAPGSAPALAGSDVGSWHMANSGDVRFHVGLLG